MSTVRFDQIRSLANRGEKALREAIDKEEFTVDELIYFAVTLTQAWPQPSPSDKECTPEGIPISQITGYGR